MYDVRPAPDEVDGSECVWRGLSDVAAPCAGKLQGKHAPRREHKPLCPSKLAWPALDGQGGKLQVATSSAATADESASAGEGNVKARL